MTGKTDKYFQPNKPFDGLGRASLHGGVTIFAARGINVFVQIASTVLLARLLGPYDFGLVTMVMAMVAFAPTLIDLGTTDAAAQQKSITRGQISSLFWLNVSIGSICTLLFAASSWFIASVFGDPTLVGIALASSLNFIFAAISIQHYALLRRAMDFRNIAIIDISANIVSSVMSVALALAGWGYWALVAKPLLAAMFIAIGAWASCPWVPGRPSFSSEVKQLVRFGLGVTGYTITDHVAKSADRLAIGYYYGAGALGYFQNAYLLYGNLLNLLTESLHNVATSGLTKLRDDVDGLKRSWAAALSSVSFLSCAAFAALAVTGQDFVLLLLGPKWEPAGPLLCVFAVRGIAHGVERTLGWLHVAAGRSDRWMRWGLVSACVQLVALAAGLPYGPIGVAIAYAVAMFGLFVPTLVYAGRPFGIGVKDVLAAAGPQTLGAVLAVGSGLLIQQTLLSGLSPLTRFSVSLLICMATYLGLVAGVFRVTEPLRLAHSVISDLRAKRAHRNV